MKIATLLNVHEDSPIVQDTLESIKDYMTKDILVLTDGASHYKTRVLHSGAEILSRIDPFGNLPVHRVEGFFHQFYRSPFRNMTLGLKTLFENWEADWYCYIEYDCLVTSSDFLEDLEDMAQRGVWMVGNDLRCGNYRIPLLDNIVGTIQEHHVMLGCCVFMHRDYMKALAKDDFFNKFLYVTNCFRETLPEFDEQGAYDIGEIIYPSLAVHYGGKVEEFARFNDSLGWTGNAERYPMRFRPDIDAAFPDASIIHPLKTYDHPIRCYNRERRKRQKCNFSLNAQAS
jgi:hypothetical protein